MLALRLPPEIEERLEKLARETGRTKSFYAREAILAHLDDIEDAYLAKRRLKPGRPRVPLEELDREAEWKQRWKRIQALQRRFARQPALDPRSAKEIMDDMYDEHGLPK